ncbi:glycosyltransferase family 2 protein [Furfurilactobacillus milii]|uniref:Glycosyltransferase n=1 Tax=Furfurilactobacillus milii TaxID=2888272 RepID=A0A6N9I1W1_9LACO|nr:glycosyltransferase family 2 protein [Furfurilactobacillus milii]MYV16386.1 glycosyltransferase [Furfurilactobacillus milii]
MRESPLLVIILPCYNEEETLPNTFKVLEELLSKMIAQNQISKASKLLFVDDGSADKTWKLIVEQQSSSTFVTGVKFSRNFGHQNALEAGLATAVNDADIMVTIDADLQDDPQVIPDMVKQYVEGVDIVYGVRSDRTSDTFFKRNSAKLFYATMHRLGVDMIPNSADFRLMSKRATKELLKFPERNMFLRAMVPLVGFKSGQVYYQRTPRMAGESKYPLGKMIRFATDGITSFSIVPIRLIMDLGITVVLIGIVILLYSLVRQFSGNTISGWTSLMVSMWVLGGIQLIGISVIGEYVGKIFTEVKQRPKYIIDKQTFK